MKQRVLVLLAAALAASGGPAPAPAALRVASADAGPPAPLLTMKTEVLEVDAPRKATSGASFIAPARWTLTGT